MILKFAFKEGLRSEKIAYNVRALCRCGIRIPSARNRCPAFDKDKCLKPMFGDVGQARTNASMLSMTIKTTSSRTCTKPTVTSRFFFPRHICMGFQSQVVRCDKLKILRVCRQV